MSRVREGVEAALRRFLDSMDELDVGVRDAWALERAKAQVEGDARPPMRLPLFREFVLPALARGVRTGTPGCARWTAKLTILIRSHEEWDGFPEDARDATGLLRCALEHDPTDRVARRQLMDELRSRLDYDMHELPDRVLCETQEECDELLDLLDELERHIGVVGITAAEDDDLFDLVECGRFHLPAYRDFLGEGQKGEAYPAFLRRTGRDEGQT